jgi:hypothetical protein
MVAEADVMPDARTTAQSNRLPIRITPVPVTSDPPFFGVDYFDRSLAAPDQKLTDLNQVYAERGVGGKIWLIRINGTIQE